MSLDVALLMAGAKERGELEKRVTTLITEIQNAGEYTFSIVSPEQNLCLIYCFLSLLCCAGNIILFVDEAHILAQYSAVGHGNKGSGLDIANLFKPSLGRGQLQVRICSFSFHW